MSSDLDLSSDLTKAKSHALKFLGFRDHSGGELLKKLGKYYDEKTSKKALAYVRELGYQSDEKYAEKLASTLIKTKHYGLRKAKYEMKLKGLPEDIIEQTLSAYDEEEILEIITGIIERKYMNSLGDSAGRKKTVDALARRGYDYDDIKTAINRIKDDMELD